MIWHKACKECILDGTCSLQSFDDVENCEVVMDMEIEEAEYYY